MSSHHRLATLLGLCLLALVIHCPARAITDRILFTVMTNVGDPPHQVGTIYAMRPDGRDVSVLVAGDYLNGYPAVSPDGRLIAFISFRRTPNPADPLRTLASSHLYVINGDGSNLRQLTVGKNAAYAPSFSPTGEWIVFSYSPSEQAPQQLYAIRPDGSGLKSLGVAAVSGSIASVAPDGSLIYCGTARDPLRNAVYHMTGAGQSLLLSGRYTASHPAVSPDGKLIAYAGQYQQYGPLYTIDIQGNNRRPLQTTGWYTYPCFSPNGERIFAVSGSGFTTRDSIVSMNLDGQDIREIHHQAGIWGPIAWAR